MVAGMAAMARMGVVKPPRNMFMAIGGKAGAAGLSVQEAQDRYLKHQSDAGAYCV